MPLKGINDFQRERYTTFEGLLNEVTAMLRVAAEKGVETDPIQQRLGKETGGWEQATGWGWNRLFTALYQATAELAEVLKSQGEISALKAYAEAKTACTKTRATAEAIPLEDGEARAAAWEVFRQARKTKQMRLWGIVNSLEKPIAL